jgi:hypothetical protein
MTIYVAAVDSNGTTLSQEWSESARGFDDFVTGLSILLGSTATLFDDLRAGWKIDNVETDPAGYLPWHLCGMHREDALFGSHEAHVVLNHMRQIGFSQQDDARITEAFVNRELSGGAFDGVETLRWFRMYRDGLIQMLELVEKNESSKLLSY